MGGLEAGAGWGTNTIPQKRKKMENCVDKIWEKWETELSAIFSLFLFNDLKDPFYSNNTEFWNSQFSTWRYYPWCCYTAERKEKWDVQTQAPVLEQALRVNTCSHSFIHPNYYQHTASYMYLSFKPLKGNYGDGLRRLELSSRIHTRQLATAYNLSLGHLAPLSGFYTHPHIHINTNNTKIPF